MPETAAAPRLGWLSRPTVQTAYRIAGIEVRNAFTDSLKRFTDYVDEAGRASSGGRGIYIQPSRRINTTFGLSREMADDFLTGGSGSLRDTCSIIELLIMPTAPPRARRCLRRLCLSAGCASKGSIPPTATARW